MGKKKLAVIAIGGNSLIKDARHVSIEDQYEAAREVRQTCDDFGKVQRLQRRNLGFDHTHCKTNHGLLQVCVDAVASETFD